MAPPTFQPIIGTLLYVWDRDADRVLVIRRNSRPDDDHYGKVNGLGGKVEVDEDIATSARRELFEEAGLSSASLELRGTATFSNFGPKREQWLIFIFVVDSWGGEPFRDNPEGQLEWVQRELLLQACAGATVEGDDDPASAAGRYPMWPGDKHFLPLVFDGDRRVFHGTMPYDRDRPVSWSYVRL